MARRFDAVSRGDALAAVLLFAGSLTLFAWTSVRPELNGLLSDSYVYLAAAEALGRDHALLAHIAATYPFPPLFPLVLGAVGGGSAAPERSYLFGAVLLAGVTVLLLRWLRAEGVPLIGAALAALAFAVLPLTLQIAMGILSEPLFMAFVFGAMLALPARGTAGRDLARRYALAALCVAAASLTRSVGVAAIAAFVLHWAWHRGWRVTRSPPLIAALPFGLWTLVKTLRGWNDYAVGALSGRDPLRLLHVNLEAWQAFAVRAVDSMSRPHTGVALALLGAIAALVWLLRLARGRFDAYYVAAYLAIMAVWPYPHHAARFLFVLLPLALAYAVLGVTRLVARLDTGRGLQRGAVALVPIAVLLLALPSSSTLLGALWRERDPALATAMRAPSWYQSARGAALASARFGRRLVEFQRATLAQVPPEACVASVIPQQVLVYGPRRGVDLTQVAARGRSLEETFAACPYVLMIAARPYPPVAGVGSLFPLETIEARMEVIAVERDRPDDPHSALVAMLARVDRGP
ncbi:MAG TPA: hypothetical protein PJ986_07105 [Gammaproteobacteria bacterium]|nr:hypothetical protein [Gammaproteobacteria bacterium]